jgi:hypothetical protein
MTYLQKLITALILFGSANQSVWAEGLADLAFPPGTRTAWVAENIEQNGVPMQIQQLTSVATVNEVLDFYRAQWKDSADPSIPGFVENKVGEWQTISQLENNLQTVIQIKNSRSGGTEGFASQIDIRSTPGSNRATRNFPRKSGSQLISSTESKDGAKTATTILLMNAFSIKSNADFYHSKMRAKGWSLAHAKNQSSVSILLFNRSGKSCEIAISKNKGRTVIFANILATKT